MPKRIFKHFGIDVFDWDDFVVIKMLTNMTQVTPPPELKAIAINHKAKPVIFDYLSCENILPNELLFMNSLKAESPNLGIMTKQYSNQVMRNRAGIKCEFHHGATVKQIMSSAGMPFKPKLDVAFLNPFLANTLKVIGSQTNTTVSAGKPFKIGDPVPSEMCAIIPLVSPIMSGIISLEIPSNVFLWIATKAMADQSLNLDKVAEFCGELAGMIFGASRPLVNDLGFDLQSTVTTYLRFATSVNPAISGPSIGVPIQTEVGALNFLVRFDA